MGKKHAAKFLCWRFQCPKLPKQKISLQIPLQVKFDRNWPLLLVKIRENIFYSQKNTLFFSKPFLWRQNKRFFSRNWHLKWWESCFNFFLPLIFSIFQLLFFFFVLLFVSEFSPNCFRLLPACWWIWIKEKKLPEVFLVLFLKQAGLFFWWVVASEQELVSFLFLMLLFFTLHQLC